MRHPSRVVIPLAAALVACTMLPVIAGAEPVATGAVRLPFVVGTSATKFSPYVLLSCTAPTGCVAVGPGEDPVSTGAAVYGFGSAVTENGSWAGTAARLPLPAGASTAARMTDLLGLSCTTTQDCEAVGAYRTASRATYGLVDTEVAGTWSAVEVPPPAGDTYDALAAIWCASAGDCEAVGFDLGASGIGSLVATESGGTWGAPTPLALPAGGGLVVPTSLSCSSTGNCVAL